MYLANMKLLKQVYKVYLANPKPPKHIYLLYLANMKPPKTQAPSNLSFVIRFVHCEKIL